MLARLRGPFNEFGFGAGCLYSVDWVISRVTPNMRLHVYDLTVQPIGDQPLLPKSKVQHVTARSLLDGDPALDLVPAPVAVKRIRFAQGAVCLLVSYKSEPLGFVWLCERRYEEDEVRCTYHVSPDGKSVFDFDFYIFPQHRLGIGFAALWQAANQYLSDRGVRFTYSRVTRFNTASRRAHARLGAQRIAWAIFLKLWTVELMFASMRPYVHISVLAAQRVQLELAPLATIADKNR